MKFTETKLAGVFLIEQERHEDERGWFARTWCVNELREHGIDPALAQCSASFNKRKGTLRGMHWQAAPHEEAKLVRCTRGRMFDVALDLREDSAHTHSGSGPSFLRTTDARFSSPVAAHTDFRHSSQTPRSST